MTDHEVTAAIDDLTVEERGDALVFLSGYCPDGFQAAIRWVHRARGFRAELAAEREGA